MANTLSKAGIVSNSTIKSGHVTQSIDALTGAIAYDITISGSLKVTGSLNAATITGSLLGTATTASYVSLAKSASYVQNAQTASYVVNAISASYVNLAQTASFVVTSQTASYVQNAKTASYITNAQTASYVANALSSSYALTASYIVGTITSASYALTASYVVNAISASYALTASYVENAQTASYVNLAQTASYIVTAQTSSITSNLANNGYIGGSTNGTQVITFNSSSLGAVTSSLGTLISSVENNNGVNTSYTIRTDISGIHSDGSFGRYIGGTLTSTWYRSSTGALTLVGSVTQLKNSTFSSPFPEFTHDVTYDILGPTYKVNLFATGKSGDTSRSIQWKATSYIVTSPSVTI